MYNFDNIKKRMSENVFPIISNIENKNIAKHIYPLKQREVDSVINNMPNNITKAIVFGSTPTWNCSIESDIDIAVFAVGDTESKNLARQIISKNCNYKCDVIFVDDIQENEKIIDEINKGVVIFEQPMR